MPSCPSCGGSYDDAFQFCPYCGKSKPISPNNDINLNISVQQGINACPSCHSNQRVEKVTTIFKSQTSQTQGQVPVETVHTNSQGEVYSSTGYRDYSASHSSNLAQLLAPPQKPTANSWNGCLFFWFLWMVVSGGLTGGVGILCAGLALVGSVFNNDPSISSSGIDRVGGVIGSIVFIIGVAGIWFLFFLGFKYFQKKKNDDKKRVETDTPIWQRAIIRWDKLFYCYRCDCIFIPGEQSVPSREMRSYIYINK